jgi:5-methylcytosine-specific restriction endonuclease McrA
MKLKAKELCPLHRRRDCCGRTSNSPPLKDRSRHGIWQLVRTGLWRSADGRERCSTGELKKRKAKLLAADPTCAACGRKFDDYRDVELSHKTGKGIGGAFRDDSMKNLTLLCTAANRDQGSMDLETYLREKWKPKICAVQ